MPGRRHLLRGARPRWLLAVACGVSCASLPVGYRLGPAPVGPVRVRTDNQGALIALMDGTTGTGVKELPDGDVLLAGHGQTDFLERLSPEGKVEWILQTCGAPGFAVADDGAIYATAETFLDLDGQAGDPAAHPPCPRPERHATRAMAAIPATIVRMNGEGHTEWRRKTSLYWADLIAAGRLLFVSGRPDDRTEHYEVIALTDWGEVGWKWDGSVASIVKSVLPGGRLLLAWAPFEPVSPAPVPSPCVLAALDEATGSSVWEQRIEVGTRCSPQSVAVSPRGGVLRAETWPANPPDDDTVAIGFDPSSGASRWERRLHVHHHVGDVPAATRVDPSLALVVEDEPYPANATTLRDGQDPVIVGIEPETGREVTVARLRADLPENESAGLDPYERVSVCSAAWGRHALLVTGNFRGRLGIGGLHVDSPSTVVTECTDIDPGYGGGPPIDAAGHCLQGSHRVREYGETLFLARVPLDQGP